MKPEKPATSNHLSTRVASGDAVTRIHKLSPLALAITSVCASGIGLPNSALAQSGEMTVEEIVVTATRREQRIQDIPYNISAYTSEDLESKRAFDLGDLSRLVPGAAYIDQGPVSRGNNNNIIIRGLNATASGNNINVPTQTVSPVSTYLGESPVFFPMTLRDIERVEVLRGPQGTLYGSGSVGGTVRIIPKRPDFDKFSYELNGLVSSTDDSDDANFSLDGVFNIPIIDDKLGLRVVAGYEEQAGFIDALGRVERDTNGVAIRRVSADITSGYVLTPIQDDVNDSDNFYVRTLLRWEPAENIDTNFLYHHEESEQNDQQVANPGVPSQVVDFGGGFANGATTFPATGENEHLILVPEPYENDFDLFNIEVNVDLGFATLTSATSYFEVEETFNTDITGQFITIGLVPYYGFFPRFLAINETETRDESFVQEIRLASDWDQRWDYVLGFYYEDREDFARITTPVPGALEWANAGFSYPSANPAFGDITFVDNQKLEFEDIAVFGELTYHINEQWQITGGIRAFWQDFTANLDRIFPFVGAFFAADGIDPLGRTAVNRKANFSDQIFKVNTSYDLNDHTMVYFTWAEGFRRGGGNTVPTAGPQASLPEFLTYDADEATNWEVGIKGTFGDRITYILAGYLVEWDKFQFDALTLGGFPVVLNGNEAETVGLEFEASGRLTEQLSFDLGYAYTKAEVTEDFTVVDLLPFAGGATGVSTQLFDGNELPGVPEHSLTFGLDYVQPVGQSGWELHWHVDGAFRSDTQSAFNNTNQNFFDVDDFWIWNASLSLDVDNWTGQLFVRNLGNEEGISGGNDSSLFGPLQQSFFVTRPRTIGLSLRFRYD